MSMQFEQEWNKYKSVYEIPDENDLIFRAAFYAGGISLMSILAVIQRHSNDVSMVNTLQQDLLNELAHFSRYMQEKEENPSP